MIDNKRCECCTAEVANGEKYCRWCEPNIDRRDSLIFELKHDIEAKDARIAELGAATKTILHYIIQHRFFTNSTQYDCLVCAGSGETPADINHAPDCAVAKAVALLKGGK